MQIFPIPETELVAGSNHSNPLKSSSRVATYTCDNISIHGKHRELIYFAHSAAGWQSQSSARLTLSSRRELAPIDSDRSSVPFVVNISHWLHLAISIHRQTLGTHTFCSFSCRLAVSIERPLDLVKSQEGSKPPSTQTDLQYHLW
jgi:hypothetical protein